MDLQGTGLAPVPFLCIGGAFLTKDVKSQQGKHAAPVRVAG